MTETVVSVMTRQDVQNTLSAYSELLKSSTKYYRKVLELSQAANEFANMLEVVGKCKGAEQSGTGLKTAAELHRVIAKNQEGLAEAIHKDFELPLQRNLIAHQKRVEENEKVYERSVRKIQDEITKTEGKMLKGRKKDLSAFQQSLQDMQKQAQELERTKQENNDRVYSDEEKNFMFLVQKTAGVVKSQYEHFSSLSSQSREATEEIISIAFAPPGKTLDAAEKKRVVDKFLGGSNAAPETVITHRASVYSVEEGRRGSQSSISSSSLNLSSFAPQQRPPAPPVAATSGTRPVTPPISPMPTGAVGSRRPSNSAIQESLMRLNIAASQVDLQAPEVTSPGTTSFAQSPLSQQSSLAPPVSAQKPSLASVTEEAPKVETEELDLVIGLHDFGARSERELSFKKNDVLLIKQRQENWLYATHYGSPVGAAKSGWIPVSYTATFKK